MHEIIVKATGHGYTVQASVGPFEREPTDRQVLAAREVAEEMFRAVTGQANVTCVAHISSPVSG